MWVYSFSEVIYVTFLNSRIRSSTAIYFLYVRVKYKKTNLVFCKILLIGLFCFDM